MKTVMLAVCMVLGLVGCSKGADQPKQAEQIRFSEADPVKRGAIAMDAIYASEGAFQQHGMGAIVSIVQELQTALAMWPETGNGEGVDACRMALKLQAIYMLNMQGKMGQLVDPRTSDFRQTCRNTISYVPDDSRMHRIWERFTS